MHNPSLPAPAWATAWVSATSRVSAWRAAWRQLRKERAQALALHRGERELAAMSLHGLRDIGAPETLLERQRRDDALPRAWTHLRG